MTIRWETRRNIVDWLEIENVRWYGRLDDVRFLERIFDLAELPSYDSRYETARDDIWQHTINNEDWESDWIYSDDRLGLLHGDDATFLRFLTELVHPIVRPDPEASAKLVQQLNDLLASDGYELVATGRIGDKTIYSGRKRTLGGGDAIASIRLARAKFGADYIGQQITRMETSIDSDPALAVGTAKELVESVCKAILSERSLDVPSAADLPRLVRLVSKELGLVPDDVSDSVRAADMVRKVLGSLATVAGGIADLRNAYGTGHGRAPGRTGIAPRHAKLVVGAASALSVFLYETHEMRTESPSKPQATDA